MKAALPISQDRRKYLIIEALRQLPVEVESFTRKKLPEELGVTTRTFNTWLNLPRESKQDIPAGALMYMAKRLGTDLEDLFNEVPQVRPFTKALKDPTNLVKKFNLS